mgnify:CR=1 FL=1
MFLPFRKLLALLISLPAAAIATGSPAPPTGDVDPFIVVLDAGHGGKDAGAIGSMARNREKDINLGITLKVGELINKNSQDIQLIYTRKNDVFLELWQRAEVANKAKANLFVSIHTNSMPKNTTRHPVGVQCYTLTLRTAGTNLEVEKRENSVIQLEQNGEQRYSIYNNSAESNIMFELMQSQDLANSVEFAKMAQNEMVRTGGRKDMGVLQANLAVLRLTYMPSVLIEVGFISTPEEEQFLLSEDGQWVMAKCIYNAIAKYKNQHTGRLSKLERVDRKPQETAPASRPGKEEPAPTPAATTATAATDTGIEFRIQVMASPKDLSPKDRQFKGLDIDTVKEGTIIKYTHGRSGDYNEICNLRKAIKDKFPDAFIIALKDGKVVNTQEAIQEWKRSQKK